MFYKVVALIEMYNLAEHRNSGKPRLKIVIVLKSNFQAKILYVTPNIGITPYQPSPKAKL